MTVSVLIITKNEARNIEKTLSLVQWADEIVVVDDFSEDGTSELASKMGASVLQRKFDGFGSQKNFGVSQCRNKWILNVDADEMVSKELKDEIQSLDDDDPIGIFEIPLQLVFLGRTFKYGKESNHFQYKLFNKNRAQFNLDYVHEKLVSAHGTKKLTQILYHQSYTSINQYFQKLNNYTDKGALLLFDKGKNRAIPITFISSFFYFFKHYIINKNFLNGREGLIWSYLNACYHTVKYLKLYELNQKK
jgi:glycosyltransferase involved in cell wall biosynthesis